MSKENKRTQQIDVHLKTLIRGLSQENIDERCKGYKALYELGIPAIPQIKEALFKSKWERVKYPGEIRYVSGLFSLIHDISEEEAERVAKKIISNGCSSTVSQLLNAISDFRLADYRTYSIKGVEIFEHKDLAGWNVQRRLESWFENVPDSDLQELHRVYVIIRDGRSNAGSYTPILFNIQVVWETVFSKFKPLSSLMLSKSNALSTTKSGIMLTVTLSGSNRSRNAKQTLMQRLS
jgi:hypothetical protein